MSTSKPVEWVSALIERFEDQVNEKKNNNLFNLIYNLFLVTN